MSTPGLCRTLVGEGEVALVPVRVDLATSVYLVTWVQLAGGIKQDLRQLQV